MFEFSKVKDIIARLVCLVFCFCLGNAWKPVIGQESTSSNSLIEEIKTPVHSGFHREYGQKWQVDMRMKSLSPGYELPADDVEAWETLIQNETADVYARLTAAVVMRDMSMSARELINESLDSKDIRTRNNAAIALAIIVERQIRQHGETEWKNRAVSLIKGRSLEQDPTSSKWIREVSEDLYAGEFPLRDQMDYLTPVPRLCYALSFSGDETLIPLFVEVLPDNLEKSVGIFRALGQIGTSKAGAELEKFLGGAWIYKSGEVSLALAKCNYKEAVPKIAKMLGPDVGRGGPMAAVESPAHRQGLLALLKLKDARAVPGIEAMIKCRIYPFETAMARMVIACLTDEDPIPGIVERLRNATTDSEVFEELVVFLGYCKDPRALPVLESAATQTENFRIAGECIRAIHEIEGNESTRALVRLLERSYPAWQKPEYFVPAPGDEHKYLPVKMQLKTMLSTRTGQTFSSSQTKEWVDNHLKD